MISVLLLRVGAALAVAGMAMGIEMGVRHDFALAPAHAHLNLVGFVALFLWGLYYHVVPESAASMLAKMQAWTAVVGALVFPIGIAAVRLVGARVEPLLVAGAAIVLASANLFAVVVFRYGTGVSRR